MTSLDDALQWLRDACGDLPEVTETITFSHPTWQANRKTFCVLDRYQGVDCVCFKTTPERQAELMARGDGQYFASPFGGKLGWTCARVGDELDWDELDELLVASWRMFANKRMLAAFDAGE